MASVVTAEAAQAPATISQTKWTLSGFGGYTSNTSTGDVDEVARNTFKAKISCYTERVSGQPKLQENLLQKIKQKSMRMFMSSQDN